MMHKNGRHSSFDDKICIAESFVLVTLIINSVEGTSKVDAVLLSKALA